MFRTSALQLTAAALIGVASLSPTTTDARETVIALSSAQPKDTLQEQVEQALAHVLKTLHPGERARLLDATALTMVAEFTMPEGNAPVSQRRALQHNRRALAQVGRFLNRAEVNQTQLGEIDLPGTLRLVRAHYPAPEGGADLIIFGDPVFVPETAPSQSMAEARVPSDGYVAAGPDASLYGTAGLPGTLAGYDVYFGWSTDAWAVSPDHRYAVERLWSITVEGHGGSMAYQALAEDPAGRATLFDLAGVDALDRNNSEPLDTAAPREMVIFSPDTGDGPMREAGTVSVNGVEVDDFSLFASEPHPGLAGVTVTTGIRYAPADYPDQYLDAWCYFFVTHDGSQHRVRLGTKDWGDGVIAADLTARGLRTAGITTRDVEVGRTACQWPTP